MAYIAANPTDWTEDMTDTVTVFKAGNLNNYGAKAIDGNGTTFACRIISDVKTSRDEQGNQIVEGGSLYILSDANIEVGDRLDLPGNNPDPRILDVKKVKYRANGTAVVHHTKVRFGSLGG